MIEVASYIDKQSQAEQFIFQVNELQDNGFVIFLNIYEEVTDQKNLTLNYVFYHPELLQTEVVKLHVSHGFIVPSLINFWTSVRTDERRIWEKYGVDFRPSFRTATYLSGDWLNEPTVLSSELQSREVERKKYQRSEWISDLEVGIRIRDKKLIDGYLFPRFKNEKNKSSEFSKVLGSLEHIHPLYADFWAQCWVRSLEEKNRVTLTERAMAVRMLLSELCRLKGHWKMLTDIWSALGESLLFKTSEHWFLRTQYLWEAYCGKGRHLSPLSFGGLRTNLTSSWISLCIDWVEEMQKNRLLMDKILHANRPLLEKLTSGQVTPDQAIKYGLGGVNLRASGFNYDERKVAPYYFYDQLDYSIPVGDSGYTYDRIVLRLEEIYQSSRLVIQLLDNLPLGEVSHDEWPLERMAIEGYPQMSMDESILSEAPHGFMNWFFHQGSWGRGTPSFRSHELWSVLANDISIEQGKACLLSFGWSYGELEL